jgi:hypothetical protein
MNPRIKDAITLAIIALGIVAAVILIILLIFWVSGNQDLLLQMLQSTAKGELFGMAFTAVGPFGMWLIVFLFLSWRSTKHIPSGSIKLWLSFPEPQEVPYPSKPVHFRKAKCWYSIYSNGKQVESDKVVPVHTYLMDKVENIYRPYIYVEAPGIENPVFQIGLKYEDHEWYSDSYSHTVGEVNLE